MDTRKESAQYLHKAEDNLDSSDRDIQATHELFQRAQNAVMLEHDCTPWTAEAYEIMMRTYRGMIINVLYSRQDVPGGRAAVVLPITAAAMEFYQKNLHHSGATINYYLTGLDACLQLASDVLASRLLTGHARTADLALLQKAAAVANDGLQMLSIKIPRQNGLVNVATDQRREVADVFAKLCHIYRALGDVDQALLYGAEAVVMFSKPGCDGTDYLAISGVYADLAESFMHDSVSKEFFEFLSGYFFDTRASNVSEFESVMDAFSKLPDVNGHREKILQQARDLLRMTPPNTPSNRAKNSLFMAQNDGYASPLLLSGEKADLTFI